MSLDAGWTSPLGRFLVDPRFGDNVKARISGDIPAIGSKFDAETVADKIVDLIFGELTAPNGGIHAETALTTLGALAGFSSQMAIREFFIKSGMISEEKAFVVIGTKAGQTFYFGDLLNQILTSTKKGEWSVWAFVGGGAQRLGAKALPDIQEIYAHVAASVGHENFGIPRLPPQNMPHAGAAELLEKFWNPVRNYLVLNVDKPSSWPLTLGVAAQKAMIRAKDIVDPALAAKIIMEAAIPMSKVNPALVFQAYFGI
jgi:hypothetical protein